MHKFEAAGLGEYPYTCLGVRENLFTVAPGHTKPGGCCDYCGTGIRYEVAWRSADGKTFVTGTDCAARAGNEEGRAAERAMRWYENPNPFKGLTSLADAVGRVAAAAMQAEREAAERAEAERRAAVVLVEGKRVVEGVVLGFKEVPAYAGGTELKALVRTDAGETLYGRLPRGCYDAMWERHPSGQSLKGARVRFNATVERGNTNDFGFFKRPTKGQVLAFAE